MVLPAVLPLGVPAVLTTVSDGSGVSVGISIDGWQTAAVEPAGQTWGVSGVVTVAVLVIEPASASAWVTV